MAAGLAIGEVHIHLFFASVKSASDVSFDRQKSK